MIWRKAELKFTQQKKDFDVQSIPIKELQGFFLSKKDIPSASKNGREALHASGMDKNLVNLVLELTVEEPIHLWYGCLFCSKRLQNNGPK